MKILPVFVPVSDYLINLKILLFPGTMKRAKIVTVLHYSS